MNKYLALVAISALLLPSFAFAQTNEDILQRISVLEALVQNLQQELNALEAQHDAPVFGATTQVTSTPAPEQKCIPIAAGTFSIAFLAAHPNLGCGQGD